MREKNNDKFDFMELVERWPSPLVGRDQATLDKFSGGLLNARSLANHDSLGTGPKVKVRVGRKVAYSAYSLAMWMKARAEENNEVHT